MPSAYTVAYFVIVQTLLHWETKAHTAGWPAAFPFSVRDFIDRASDLHMDPSHSHISCLHWGNCWGKTTELHEGSPPGHTLPFRLGLSGMGIMNDSLYTWQAFFLEDNLYISTYHTLSGDASPHHTLSNDVPITHRQMTSEANTVIVYRSWQFIRAYGWRLSQMDLPIAGTAQNTEQRTHNTSHLGDLHPVFHRAASLALFLHANFGISGIWVIGTKRY